MGISQQERNRAATKFWLFAAAAAICWAVVTMAILLVVSSHDPLFDTLSSYAFTDHGDGMLAKSILSLAAGSLALLIALRAAGIVISRTSFVLFGTWSLGLVVAALFPASYPEHPNAFSGVVHQYSAVLALVSLPVLGCSLLSRFSDMPLTWLTVAAGGGLLMFAISLLWPSLIPFGIVQRAALAVDVALLGRLLMLVRSRVRNQPVSSGLLAQGGLKQ
ncbi:DUF998 domain-containing protein [Amycolatopsis taiwanensis]|uniref:DUF998 domain-containing protein n=1 Tax=Amycolatopsis taiwanensis TaxID=342230 RepID=A0A9W6QUH8_9PSEU|nr:DUF998 domain-containing protein [Amycolatopsis taiwanensis]GLY63809.1 hypothetical protein Atai01_04280 [Amycolatopsis taiwanensis]